MSRLFRILGCVTGSAILAFGLYHVHSQGVVTEGGILGLSLLLHQWYALSPAVTAFFLNAACYLAGQKVLGKSFLLYSALSCFSYSLFYGAFERLPLLWPQLEEQPFAAAVFGAVFVGTGVGLCVRCGGAPSGDDALAMTISRISPLSIEQVYLISDLCVLALSLSYIPPQKIFYSLLTVLLSGQLIGLIQKIPGKSHG